MRIIFLMLISFYTIIACNYKKKEPEFGYLLYDSDKKILLYNFEYDKQIYLSNNDGNVKILGDSFLIVVYDFDDNLDYCESINPELKCFQPKEKIWGNIKRITLYNSLFNTNYKYFITVFDKSFEYYLKQKGKGNTTASIDDFLDYQKEHGFLIELKYVELN